MRVLDLFSGIGGFSLGLERAGMETVAFCEYDKKAQLVLKKHWPEVPIYEDVRTLTGEQIAKDIGAIDLICGGFPCQGFSLAGKRKGQDDERYLWPEYFRLIQEIRPRWVIGENVPGIIDLALDQVLSDLEGESYAWETFNIPACGINAPHKRERIWIVAFSTKIGFQGISPGPNIGEKIEHDAGCLVGGISSPSTPTYTNEAVKELRGQVGRMGWEQQIQRFRDWEITFEPFVCRGNHGIPGRVDRLKQIGNAVVPQIVEIFGHAIMEIENNQLR